MTNENKKYPLTVGLYRNKFSEKLVLSSFPTIDQEQADKLCAAIQAAVGGYLEVREKGGTSKNGKRLPDFQFEAVTLEESARRKEFGAQQKAERVQHNDGDASL